MDKRYRLFVDMDGTLAEFKKLDTLEKLYEKEYFLELKPLSPMVDVIRNLQENHSEAEVFILSAVLTDSPYALDEKNAWLNKYLPEINSEHRIFVPCGSNKNKYIPGGIRETDFLLDDYTKNLMAWGNLWTGIKVLNGINGTHGTWKGNSISIFQSAETIEKNIMDIMQIERCINLNFRKGGR